MDLNQFFSNLSSAPSGAFNSRHFNLGLTNEVRELAQRGLKLFPVGLAAKLAGDPDRLIAGATDDIRLLEGLSAAAQPLSGYRLAVGQSGLIIWRLDGGEGIASFASLAFDLDEGLTTLQGRRGDAVYVLFQRPGGMKPSTAAGKLPSGVSIFSDGAGFDVPPAGGAVWQNPGAEIEPLPYVLREILASDPPDSSPGRAVAVQKASPRPAPRRSAVYFPRPDEAALRREHPVYRQRGGYRISSRR